MNAFSSHRHNFCFASKFRCKFHYFRSSSLSDCSKQNTIQPIQKHYVKCNNPIVIKNDANYEYWTDFCQQLSIRQLGGETLLITTIPRESIFLSFSS